MPEWSDQALILSVRPYAEYDAVVNVLTTSHGRQAGLVRGGQSSKHRGTLQRQQVYFSIWVKICYQIGWPTVCNMQSVRMNLSLKLELGFV